MFNQVARQIAQQLATAGVQAELYTEGHMVCVAAECETTARDVLGFERFTGYMDGVEVVIIEGRPVARGTLRTVSPL